MYDLWVKLSDGQGSVLSAAITVLGTLAALLIGYWALNGKVKSIEEAIASSQEMVERHLQNLTKTLADVQDKTAQLDEMLAALGPKVAALSADSAENDLDPPSLHEDAVPVPSRPSVSEQAGLSTREEVKKLWHGVRDTLERIASDPSLDGRRRAKYMRIDRRSYYDLISSMKADETISATVADAAETLYAASKRYRRAHSGPSPEELAVLSELAVKVQI